MVVPIPCLTCGGTGYQSDCVGDASPIVLVPESPALTEKAAIDAVNERLRVLGVIRSSGLSDKEKAAFEEAYRIAVNRAPDRVTELLAANNRLVEEKRAAERRVEKLLALLERLGMPREHINV